MTSAFTLSALAGGDIGSASTSKPATIGEALTMIDGNRWVILQINQDLSPLALLTNAGAIGGYAATDSDEFKRQQFNLRYDWHSKTVKKEYCTLSFGGHSPPGGKFNAGTKIALMLEQFPGTHNSTLQGMSGAVLELENGKTKLSDVSATLICRVVNGNTQSDQNVTSVDIEKATAGVLKVF